jgi:hypothetical protein
VTGRLQLRLARPQRRRERRGIGQEVGVMALPKTKAELLAATARDRDALLAYLESLSCEQMLKPGEYGWSARDHVAHLAEWERMLFGWYDSGRRGESPAVPAEGYTWAQMDALNRQIFEQHIGDDPELVMAEWRDTSRRLLALAESLSEADLFTPGRFAWTGRGTLGSFVYECGANHYRWAGREIRNGFKVRR